MGNSPPSHHSKPAYARPSYRPAAPPPGVLTVQSEPIQTKPAAAELKVDVKTMNNEEVLGNLPSGYVRIHGGLKLPGNDSGHSSPLFVINLYKDEDKVQLSQDQTGEASVGEQKTALNPKRRTKRVDHYMTCTEELRIIPVEDIIAINYSSQFRKSTHHEEQVDAAQEVEYTGKIFKKKQYRDVEHVTNKNAQHAKRLITIEIEYFKYVNPDSASIVRGLNHQEREKLISRMAEITQLKFNLINNKDFEKEDYTEKQQQAELLCRAVIHLKTLRVYPSIQELPELFHQESLESLGHVFVERNFNEPPSARQQHPPAIEMRKQQQTHPKGRPQRAALPQPSAPKVTEVDDDDDDDNDNGGSF